MKFVLAMAARETRSSWQRLIFFFVCIAVGVAAIVALRSVIQSVREVFTSEAKGFMASDVLISSNREWSDVARAAMRDTSAGRTIVGVSIVSVCAIACASAIRLSMVARDSPVQSRLVAMSASAAISDRASPPSTSRTLRMTDRSATMAATPTAMQTKKKMRR